MCISSVGELLVEVAVEVAVLVVLIKTGEKLEAAFLKSCLLPSRVEGIRVLTWVFRLQALPSYSSWSSLCNGWKNLCF